MIKIYGTMQCPDCVDCKRVLDAAGVQYEFKNVEELMMLREFLEYRDQNPILVELDFIGIPCIVLEDGTVTMDFNKIAQEHLASLK